MLWQLQWKPPLKAQKVAVDVAWHNLQLLLTKRKLQTVEYRENSLGCVDKFVSIVKAPTCFSEMFCFSKDKKLLAPLKAVKCLILNFLNFFLFFLTYKWICSESWIRNAYYPGTRHRQKVNGNRSLTLANKQSCLISVSHTKPNSQSVWYNSIDFSYGHQCSWEKNVNYKIPNIVCYGICKWFRPKVSIHLYRTN